MFLYIYIYTHLKVLSSQEDSLPQIVVFETHTLHIPLAILSITAREVTARYSVESYLLQRLCVLLRVSLIDIE